MSIHAVFCTDDEALAMVQSDKWSGELIVYTRIESEAFTTRVRKPDPVFLSVGVSNSHGIQSLSATIVLDRR